MKKAGDMWILDSDPFIGAYFSKSGDQFEIDHLNQALIFVKNFRCAIDGGAHYGSWSRYLAKKFNRVISFEPNLKTFECAKLNLIHLPNVDLRQEAIGERIDKVLVGRGKMYSHPGMETIIGIGDIPLVTIDSLNLDCLDFLKLDLEGYEYHALSGAVDTLVRYKPIVIFEENVRGKLEHNIEMGRCGNLLNSLGAKFLKRMGSDYVYGWN